MQTPETVVPMTVRVPKATIKEVRKLAIDLDILFQEAMAEAMADWVQKHQKSKK